MAGIPSLDGLIHPPGSTDIGFRSGGLGGRGAAESPFSARPDLRKRTPSLRIGITGTERPTVRHLVDVAQLGSLLDEAIIGCN